MNDTELHIFDRYYFFNFSQCEFGPVDRPSMERLMETISQQTKKVDRMANKFVSDEIDKLTTIQFHILRETMRKLKHNSVMLLDIIPHVVKDEKIKIANLLVRASHAYEIGMLSMKWSTHKIVN